MPGGRRGRAVRDLGARPPPWGAGEGAASRERVWQQRKDTCELTAPPAPLRWPQPGRGEPPPPPPEPPPQPCHAAAAAGERQAAGGEGGRETGTMGREKTRRAGRDYLRRPWQAGEVRSDPAAGVSGPELRQKREASPPGRHPSEGTAPAPPPPPLLPAAVWGAAAPAPLPPPAPAPRPCPGELAPSHGPDTAHSFPGAFPGERRGAVGAQGRGSPSPASPCPSEKGGAVA